MEIKVTGYDDLSRYFSKLVDHLNNPHATMKKAGLMMHTDVMDHFRKQMGPDEAWASWLKNGKRVSSRPTKRGGTKLLQDTGRLRNSFVIASSRSGAVVGTNVVYANTHQMGNSSKNIVARPFCWLSDEMSQRIADMFVTDMRNA